MSRPLAVLRAEPGASATAARIAALGATAIKLPMFETRPVAWEAPDPTGFDALLLTSANAARHAGPQLARLLRLPVLAVGEATAAEAERVGLSVAMVGSGSVNDLLRAAQAYPRLLHLAGRERTLAEGARVGEVVVTRIITVYAADPVPIDASRLEGTVALVHSPRAANRLAEIVQDRSRIAVAAISDRALALAGSGWAGRAHAVAPNDAALIAAALRLAD